MYLWFRRPVRLIWAILSTVGAAAAQPDGAAYFEKKIRPLLLGKCLSCHSASSVPVMGGLRLDDREAALKGGGRGPAIVSGKPEESLLLKVVRHTAGPLKMPPGPRLKDEEIAALTEWVAMGAPWGASAVSSKPAAAALWSLVPPRKPTLPKTSTPGWITSPVDAFILAALESKGLRPAPPADKRTLLRRATFDLTGLPPTPEEINAFLADNSPDAFATVIERLLASPRYGERWGRHWLDVARYADSNGLDENLVYKNAYRYRDYVIQSFNRDKPYDEFIHEQLAGDLLPESSDLATMYERWTATGFLSLGAKMLAEDDPVKMEMDIVDEQLDTTARTFMGLTVGCARCHDHKYDPIPQSDYYAMAGIFKSSKTMENFKVVAQWHEYVLAPKPDRDRLAAHLALIEAKRKEAGKITSAENAKLVAEAMRRIGDYLLASHDLMLSERMTLEPLHRRGAAVISRDASGYDNGNVASPIQPKKANTVKGTAGPHFAEYRITVSKSGNYQVDLLDEERGAGTADILINGQLVKRGAEPVQNREASPDAGGWAPAGVFPLHAGENTIRLEHRTRFPYFARLAVAAEPVAAGAAFPRSTVQIARARGVNPSFLEQMVEHLDRSNGAPASVLWLWETFDSGRPLAEWKSPAAALFPEGRPATREQLAARYQALFQEAVRQWEALPDDARKKTEGGKEPALPDAGLESLRQLLYEKFGPMRAPADARTYYPADVRADLARIEKETKLLEEATPQFPRAMGVTEGGKAGDLRINIRGSHWNLGESVPRGFLRAVKLQDPLPAIPAGASGRLELARWLTRKDHPLTSRVMVNRIWRWHFGKGIVPSVDNFGRLGEKPTHPELLDWLAATFVEKGWSIKEMHRILMNSSTYRMSSAFDARAAETDPENTLLWRMSRRRLEAEELRDAIMSVSGGLDFQTGGSILKYKDREYVANTSRRGDIDYDRNIRAVYIPVVRSSMYDLFRAFDLPDPSVPNGDRDSTVVAPQALFAMNGSVMLTHSRKMAGRLLDGAGPDDPARIRAAYEAALARPPSAAEVDRALTFLAQIDSALRDRRKDPAERRLLAWQSFCKALLASNEFTYLN